MFLATSVSRPSESADENSDENFEMDEPLLDKMKK